MNEQVTYLKKAMIAAGLISCALPLSSSALSLGEITLHSRLGQPLRASVALRAEPDEELDVRCFSLGRPASVDEQGGVFLTQARLELMEKGGKHLLKLSSSQSVNEPFVRLLLRGGCGEQGHLGREYTLLLDPPEHVVESSAVLSVLPTESDVQSGDDPGRALRSARPTSFATPVRSKRQRVVQKVAEQGAPSPVGAQSQSSFPQEQERGFRLKLSTADLDLSLLGKMSEADRQRLREKQLLLDADDQVANTLSMKHRIKQLEEQIESMQKVLEQNSKRMSLSEKLAAPPPQPIPLGKPDAGINWLGLLSDTSVRSLAGAALILALAVSAWWRWRRRQAEAQLDYELDHEFAASEMPRYVPPAPPPVAQHPVSENKAAAPVVEDEDYLPGVTSIFERDAEAVTFTEVESVLDEADLYLAYGWANRAIDALQASLDKHADDPLLWQKLFDIYASQGMKQEFEQLALRCQASLNDSALWENVKKLGRTLDKENPLYAAAEGEAEESEAMQPADEVPTLDTPLEFVLDHDQASPPAEDAQAASQDVDSGHLKLDPLFPELSEQTQIMHERKPGEPAAE